MISFDSHGVMAAMFLIAAILQYNDEYGVIWAVVYLAACACSISAVRSKFSLPRKMYWMLMGLSVVGTGVLLPKLLSRQDLSPNIFRFQEGREIGGLVLIAGEMLVLLLQQHEVNLTRRNPSTPWSPSRMYWILQFIVPFTTAALLGLYWTIDQSELCGNPVQTPLVE